MSRDRGRCGLLNPRNMIEQEERRNGGKQKQAEWIPGFSRCRLSLRSSVSLVQFAFSKPYAGCS